MLNKRFLKFTLLSITVHIISILSISLLVLKANNYDSFTFEKKLKNTEKGNDNKTIITANIANLEEKTVAIGEVLLSPSSEYYIENFLNNNLNPQEIEKKKKEEEQLFLDYLSAWILQVEYIGNQIYPTNQFGEKLLGSLIVSVEINHDGTIKSTTIKKSSGQKELDDATIDILYKSTPFIKFPPSLKEKTKTLTITKVWNFTEL